MSNLADSWLNPIQVIVFDLDGVLVDSEPLSRQIWEQVLATHGVVLDEAVYRRMIGHRSPEGAAILIEHYGLPLLADELAAAKNRIWEERWLQGLPPMIGLEEIMAALAACQIRWAVATSSPRRYADCILRDLGIRELCSAIAAGDEVAAGKPAPDLYLLAAQRLAVPAGACLAVEDSVTGGMAAQAAGMTLIALPAGVTSPADFPFAPYIFPSLAALAANLNNLLKNEP